MFPFLRSGIVDRFSKSVKERNHPFVPLTVEELEERCVLSVDTTVASPSAPSPFTAPGDVIVASQPKGNPGIVFLGDSITWGFANGLGAPVWSAAMAPLGAADYGVSGQTTQSLLFQLSLGQLVGINPSVVVLTIGTNNLFEGDSPQDTAAGILADVMAIHQYLPDAHVLVLGTPPGGANPTDTYRLQTEQTDALLQPMLADDPRTTFINVAPALEQPDGTISIAVLIDSIHPTALGYFDLMNALAAPLARAIFFNIDTDLANLHGSIPPETLAFSWPEMLAMPSLPDMISLPRIPLVSVPSGNPPPTPNPVLTPSPSDGKVANWLISSENSTNQSILNTSASPNGPTSTGAAPPTFEQPLGKLPDRTWLDTNTPTQDSAEGSSAPETLDFGPSSPLALTPPRP